MTDTGSFVVTNQRCVFVGSKRSTDWAFSKLLGYSLDGGLDPGSWTRGDGRCRNWAAYSAGTVSVAKSGNENSRASTGASVDLPLAGGPDTTT